MIFCIDEPDTSRNINLKNVQSLKYFSLIEDTHATIICVVSVAENLSQVIDVTELMLYFLPVDVAPSSESVRLNPI